MYFLYSLIYTLGFIVLLPRYIISAVTRGKYSGGFKQRLGFVPEFKAVGKRVVWLHCVSVGEANTARTLAEAIKKEFPNCRIVVSTTTKTGQKVAKAAFADIADLVFYFPFDWRWTVRRALHRIGPSVVLLMETEIWFNFIREANKQKVKLAIVNGRLSERSFKRYGYIKRTFRRVVGKLDMAIMQEKADATRLMSLGLRASKVKLSGNIKFDHGVDNTESNLTEVFRKRFGISADAPLIVAASTHGKEEVWILDAFKNVWKSSTKNLPRLLIAPRHPERFAEVTNEIKATGFTWVRRSEIESGRDTTAEIILLDSIGELRSAFPLAEIVFVGGSLIPHGGQSIFEPAASGRAIITGPHTTNFEAAVSEFLDKDALIQLPAVSEDMIADQLVETFADLLSDPERRQRLGRNALAVMNNNRGAVDRTIEYLEPLLGKRSA